MVEVVGPATLTGRLGLGHVAGIAVDGVVIVTVVVAVVGGRSHLNESVLLLVEDGAPGRLPRLRDHVMT